MSCAQAGHCVPPKNPDSVASRSSPHQHHTQPSLHPHGGAAWAVAVHRATAGDRPFSVEPCTHHTLLSYSSASWGASHKATDGGEGRLKEAIIFPIYSWDHNLITEMHWDVSAFASFVPKAPRGRTPRWLHCAILTRLASCPSAGISWGAMWMARGCWLRWKWSYPQVAFSLVEKTHGWILAINWWRRRVCWWWVAWQRYCPINAERTKGNSLAKGVAFGAVGSSFQKLLKAQRLKGTHAPENKVKIA